MKSNSSHKKSVGVSVIDLEQGWGQCDVSHTLIHKSLLSILFLGEANENKE